MKNTDPENKKDNDDFLGDALNRIKNGDLPEEENPDNENAQQEKLASKAEENFLAVSADMPENQRLKEIRDLRKKFISLEQAFEVAGQTIQNLETQLNEANDRIASLLLERTENIDSMIDSLRKFQTEGTALGPVGSKANALKTIFSVSDKIQARAQQVELNTRVEADIRLALNALKAASSDAFTYDLITEERPNIAINNTRNIDAPTKFIQANLSTNNPQKPTQGDKIILLICQNKIFYQQETKISEKFNYKKSFLNKTGHATFNLGCFWKQGDSIVYKTNNYGKQYAMSGPYASVADFMDEFVSECLNNVIPSNEFDQAIRSLRTMQLIP